MVQQFRRRANGTAYPITPRVYRAKTVNKSLSLTSTSQAVEDAKAMHDRFLNAKDRKTKLAIKRAVVSAGNKAETTGQHDVALVYRKTHTDMLLPAKDGLVYRTNAVGKREKVEYDGMYLSNLQEERAYAAKRGWTGEVKLIDKELARRKNGGTVPREVAVGKTKQAEIVYQWNENKKAWEAGLKVNGEMLDKEFVQRQDETKDMFEGRIRAYAYNEAHVQSFKGNVEMPTQQSKYYVVQNKGLYELRQTRFKSLKKDHPHDVCAVARTEEEMKEMRNKFNLY